MAYFSNGTEGMILDEQCLSCICEDDLAFCPVHCLQCTWNYSQLDKGNEKIVEILNELIDENGICLVREAFIEAGILKQQSMKNREHLNIQGNLKDYWESKSEGKND
jgi:hypothetical protein